MMSTKFIPKCSTLKPTPPGENEFQHHGGWGGKLRRYMRRQEDLLEPLAHPEAPNQCLVRVRAPFELVWGFEAAFVVNGNPQNSPPTQTMNRW